MGKVFCKNCKHFTGRCNYEVRNKFNDIIVTIGSLLDNKYGDCINYKKDWWKFWVK